jgi:uncharacterized membrane protein
MSTERDAIFEWAEGGQLAPGHVAHALRIAGAILGPAEWRRFVDRLLLGLAVALAGAGVVFFVAANWQALGRFGKFALVELAIVVALGVCWHFGLSSRVGKSALGAAALCTGALLALVGQVYQTGADTWELFAAWAVAIAVWVAVARMPALWLLWLGLLNIALVLYFNAFGGLLGLVFGTRETLWALFALDSAALVAWEVLAAGGIGWLRARWAVAVLAAASGVAATWLALWSIFDSAQAGGWGLVAYVAWLAAIYGAYRLRRVDRLILAGGVLSLIVVVTSVLGHNLLRHDRAGSFLLIAMAVVAMAAAGTWWLRRVPAEEAV